MDGTATATAVAPKKSNDVQELESQTRNYPVVTVTDAASFEEAANNLRDLKTLQDRVEAVEKSATKPLNDALKTVRSWFRPMKDRLAKAEGDQRSTMGSYKRKQDELARAAARKAEADARAERERLEAEARAAEDKARREAAARRVEADRIAAEDAAKAERLRASAAGIEEKAHARADTLLERADSVVAAPVAPAAPKVEGLSNREVWKFEIRDASKINAGFLIPDEKKIGKTVKALKGDARAVIGEGVHVWSDADFSARRR